MFLLSDDTNSTLITEKYVKKLKKVRTTTNDTDHFGWPVDRVRNDISILRNMFQHVFSEVSRVSHFKEIDFSFLFHLIVHHESIFPKFQIKL